MIALVLALGALAAPADSARPVNRPYGVGERLEYAAKLGFLRLGTGAIRVAGIDTVRGVPSYHFEFSLQGGNAIYRLNSSLESWTGVADLKSRRFHSSSNENGRIRERKYEIFPDSGFYRQAGVADPVPTSAHPLDDASFLFYIRTIPLDVGKTYQLDYYFRKDKNPLVMTVEKREMMEMPDGTKVPCLVIKPIIGDRGLFAAKQNARVWLTDDARRLPVQIQTRYPFGVVTLQLERITLAPGTGA